MSQDKVLLTRRNCNWNNSYLLTRSDQPEGDDVDYPLTGSRCDVVEPQAVFRRVAPDASPIAPLAGDRSGAVSFSPQLAQTSAKSDEEETDSLPNFTRLDLIICIYSIVSYILDVGSDIWLAVHYYQEGQITWFILTISPPIVASIIMTVLSLLWYHNDSENGLETSIPRWRWVLRIFFHVFQLCPLIR